MLDRFIIYQSIIECLTILRRNVVSDFIIVNHLELKKNDVHRKRTGTTS